VFLVVEDDYKAVFPDRQRQANHQLTRCLDARVMTMNNGGSDNKTLGRKSLHHFATPVYWYRYIEIHHPPSKIFGNESHASRTVSAFTNIGIILTPISLTHEVPCLAV
jgi:hypothetical protein